MTGTIVLLTTGGTVDKDYGTGAGVVDVHIADSYFLSVLQRYAPGFRVLHQEVLRKDSTQMSPMDRQNVLHGCWRAAEHEPVGVIVSHGTDTLLETAALVNGADADKPFTFPIVFTGSLRPGTMKDTDADFQIGLALATCLCKPSGVWVALGGVHDPLQCRKDPRTGQFVPK